jgi:hypothetical protein
MRPSPRFADRAGLPFLLGLAGALITASCSPAPPVLAAVAAPQPPRPAAATPGQGRPRITAKHGMPPEEATRRQLERLLDQYELSPWRFTGEVEIDEDDNPHSHPVLTLSTRHVKDDLLLLSTYLHEQSHWYFEAHPETRAAMAELEAQFPGLPVGFPDGANDHDASYEHLCVNTFEYEALRRLVGELAARQVLEFWTTDHYRVLYRTVLDHRRDILAVMKHHGLEPPGQPPGTAIASSSSRAR